MKKFLLSLLFISIGMAAHSTIYRYALKGQRMLLAKYSYETGCLNAGTESCYIRYNKEDDTNIIFRGQCLESILVACQSRAIQYKALLEAGPNGK